jgi:hypothetical protein
MSHERTKLGRALLKQRATLQKWIELNRGSADTESAELLSCELYYAAMNGDASRLLRR